MPRVPEIIRPLSHNHMVFWHGGDFCYLSKHQGSLFWKVVKAPGGTYLSELPANFLIGQCLLISELRLGQQALVEQCPWLLLWCATSAQIARQWQWTWRRALHWKQAMVLTQRLIKLRVFLIPPPQVCHCSEFCFEISTNFAICRAHFSYFRDYKLVLQPSTHLRQL